MSAKSKRNVLKFGLFSIAAAANFLSFGCDVQSIEQSSTNSNAETTANNFKRLNFAAINSPSEKPNSNGVDSAAAARANHLVNIKTSETPEIRAEKSPVNSQFDAAAAQNLSFSRNLVWTFGGRSQTGWYLYKPLICQTIGVSIEAGESKFAETLSFWQKENGFLPNGVLDAPTLALFVAEWQANRLKIRGYASPNELTVAPTSDFYDAARPDELRLVERETYAAYKRLIAAALADKSLNLKSNDKSELDSPERFLKIVSSFRSREYQEKLRRESPNSGRAGLAVNNSPHFTGRALDVYVGGEPVITKDENRFVQINTPIYLWLVKNAGKFGFKPYFFEPWHWEYAPD